MIAALRTTLAMVLARPRLLRSRPTAARRGRLDRCRLHAARPRQPTAVRERADAVTDVFAGKVREVEARTAVGGGEGKANQGNEPTDGADATTTRRPRRADRPADPRPRWQHTVVVEDPFRSSLQPGDRMLVVTEPAGRRRLRQARGRRDLRVLRRPARGDGPPRRRRRAPAPSSSPGGLSAGLRDSCRRRSAAEPEDTVPDYSLSAPDDGARSTPSLGRLAAPGRGASR